LSWNNRIGLSRSPLAASAIFEIREFQKRTASGGTGHSGLPSTQLSTRLNPISSLAQILSIFLFHIYSEAGGALLNR
jgi:hypothetical protein